MMDLPPRNSFDEILLQLTRVGLSAQPISPRKVLFWGERAGEISSYVAGWLAGKGIEVIVLDGANRFDPYMVSSFARKALIPPERLLKRIRIARAFTCYQMAMMVGERLNSLLSEEGAIGQSENRWVILLGPVTPFMDEDVSEREARPLFERSLKKIEEMALRGIPFFLFQPNVFSENPPFPPFAKGGVGGLRNSKRVYLMRRLFQFSNEVWRISLEDQEPRVVLEKGLTKSQIADSRLKNPCLDDSVIPVLARRSASARRRVNGNLYMNIIKKYGFLLPQEWQKGRDKEISSVVNPVRNSSGALFLTG